VTSASTTGVINFTADNFTSTVPYLTNYNALNGLNPAAAFTFSFPAFTPNPGVTEGFTFFTIYDARTGPLVGNAFTTQGFDLRTEGSFTTAPAPSIGFGLPVFLVVGGLWMGARFLDRNPNTTSRNRAVLRGARPASSGLLAAALIAVGFVNPRRRAPVCLILLNPV
jgi:hypothetical protein